MLADESRFSRPHPLQVAGSSQDFVTGTTHKLCLLPECAAWQGNGQRQTFILRRSLRGAVL